MRSGIKCHRGACESRDACFKHVDNGHLYCARCARTINEYSVGVGDYPLFDWNKTSIEDWDTPYLPTRNPNLPGIELMKLWVKALRSGYSQGYEYLRKRQVGPCKFCALGLLVHLYHLYVEELEIKVRSDGIYAYDHREAMIPSKVGDYLIRHHIRLNCNTIMLWNDTYEWSFKMIAEAIEQRNYSVD